MCAMDEGGFRRDREMRCGVCCGIYVITKGDKELVRLDEKHWADKNDDGVWEVCVFNRNILKPINRYAE